MITKGLKDNPTEREWLDKEIKSRLKDGIKCGIVKRRDQSLVLIDDKTSRVEQGGIITEEEIDEWIVPFG